MTARDKHLLETPQAPRTLAASAHTGDTAPAEPPAAAKKNIKDYTLAELTAWMTAQGEPVFHARQIFQWLYQKRVRQFQEMTTLSKSLRMLLESHFHMGNLEAASRQESSDGSRKFAFRLSDGRLVEAVLMPNNTHYTVCISSQVGCAMGCAFCMTAKMGLERNLTPGEIVGQVVELAREIQDDKLVRNVVYMGMGEPLHNFEPVMSSLAILQEDFGFGLSQRRITVSTSGLVPAIRRFGAHPARVMLAISLNGVTDATRGTLMPVNRRWPIAEVLQACRDIPSDNRYRITFEYILMKGVTDDLADARKLVRLLHGMKCKVNLIPYNPYPGSPFHAPDLERCHAFQRLLLERGLLATLRISKGQDIQAACGQLITGAKTAAERVKMTLSELEASLGG